MLHAAQLLVTLRPKPNPAPAASAKRWLARWTTALAAALLLISCGEVANLSVAAGTGLRPDLPSPQNRAIPTVNIAPAIGWTQGAMPVAAAGMRVQAFTGGLDHPRWIYKLPNGDMLVAESNAPEKPDDAQGLRRWAMGLIMKRAGAKTVSANRITLLRDTNSDGIADQRFVFLTGLNSPFGMALVKDQLYIANSDAIWRYPYQTGDTHIVAAGVQLVALQPPRPDLVAKALVPDYALGPHTASLGLASAQGNQLPSRFAQGMFVGQHGSCNRRPHSGYKVVFVPFIEGRPSGALPLDVLDGFLSADGKAYGRPVGVALDKQGALLVADDVGNVIWRVSAESPASAQASSKAQP